MWTLYDPLVRPVRIDYHVGQDSPHSLEQDTDFRLRTAHITRFFLQAVEQSRSQKANDVARR